MPHPNFIYIGPDKAGSSWLHEVLIRHDDIFMPPAKDLYFFDRYYSRGLAWYLDQFEAAGGRHKIVGEVCQDYLFHPESPARIRESLADARLMVTHLQRFADVFGRSRLHVAVFDDLVRDPQQFIDDLLRWLQVSSMTLTDEQVRAQLPAGRARSVLMARVARRAAEIVRERDGANMVGRVKRSPLVQRALYRQWTSDKPTMTDDERAAVHDALLPEVVELDRQYGLDLVRRWGWPAADRSELSLDSGTS